MTAMADEILATPGVVERLLVDGRTELEDAGAAVRSAAPRWASIVGRGTSDHAATYGRYLLETIVGLPTGLAAPSVTTVYRATLEQRDGLVVAVSQSGQSPDVVGVVTAARKAGALTIAITNDPGSPLAEAAARVIDCRAGEERSVAATKTYVAELAAFAALVAAIRPEAGLGAGLGRLAGAVRLAVEAARAWVDTSPIAEHLAGADRALVVSRGYNLATALETALKLKETSGLFAEGYSTADLLHGPVALASPAVPALAFRPEGAMGPRVDDVVARIAAVGGRSWLVGGPSLRRARTPGDGHLSLDFDLPDALSPAVLVVAGQVLAESVARRRGRDPDAPAGLTKITRTD